MHEFGVKYPKGKMLFVLGLALLASLLYYHQSFLPVDVTDMYFRISNHTPLLVEPNIHEITYLFAPFNFEYPFYQYAPLFPCVYQMSRFISLPRILAVVALNAWICGVYGRSIVKKRVKEYEIWNNENICFGEGTYLSLTFCFLTTFFSKQRLFSHPKLILFLRSIPGMGIVRRGVGIGYICLFYTCL